MASLSGLLFPSTEIAVVTLLDPAAAQERLVAASQPRGGGWYFKRKRAGQRFVMRSREPLVLERLVPYPDPWRPELRFGFSPRGSGADVTVTLGLSRSGRIVTILWHGLAVVVCLGLLAAVVSGVILPRALGISVLAVAYMALPALDQRVEAKATRALLMEVLG